VRESCFNRENYERERVRDSSNLTATTTAAVTPFPPSPSSPSIVTFISIFFPYSSAALHQPLFPSRFYRFPFSAFIPSHLHRTNIEKNPKATILAYSYAALCHRGQLTLSVALPWVSYMAPKLFVSTISLCEPCYH